jgi:hypothetical protein
MNLEVAGTTRSPSSLWLPLAAAAALSAVGYYPTRHLCSDAGTKAMAAAILVVAGSVCVTLAAALRRLATSDPAARMKASLKAAVVRMMLTIGVAGLVAWKAWVEPAPFLVWVAISYVLLIKVETLVLLRQARHHEKRI